MGTTPFARLPYPEITDIDDPVGDMEALAESLDGVVLLKAASAADRDSRFQLAPRESLIVAPGIIWIKTSDTANTYEVVWETPVTPDPAASSSSWVNLPYPTLGHTNRDPGVMQAKRVGSITYLRGTLKRADNTAIPPSPEPQGHFLTTIPVGFRPARNMHLPATVAPTNLLASPIFRLDISASSGQVTWHYPLGSISWLDISCSYRND